MGRAELASGMAPRSRAAEANTRHNRPHDRPHDSPQESPGATGVPGLRDRPVSGPVRPRPATGSVRTWPHSRGAAYCCARTVRLMPVSAADMV
jgi:hypothetical protein